MPTLAMARTNRTKAKRKLFLEGLADTASVTAACKLAGIRKARVYEWRHAEEAFADQWDEAMNLGSDVLEDEAVRRGHKGVLEPVFQGGKRVGSVRKYSDTLLMFLLNGRRPEKYQRQRIEHTGKNGGAIEVKDVGLMEAARRVAFLLHTAALKLPDQVVATIPKGDADESS